MFVHQSAELYGSDKTLLGLVRNLDRRVFQPIVLLPSDGLLYDELIKSNIEVYKIPLARLSRATISFFGLLKLPINIVKSLWYMAKVIDHRKVDLVHSNTLAVISGAFYAKAHKVKHVWHVHEIINSPLFAGQIYSYLLRWTTDAIVCNSYATKSWCEQIGISSNLYVVWNGLDRDCIKDNKVVERLQLTFGIMRGEKVVVLVGRINRLKGHKILVKSANELWARNIRNIHFLMVGDSPIGQEHYKKSLEKIINMSPVKDKIHIVNFCNDIWSIWDLSDVAVIPSTEPESFGMVALEAMLSNKPVIASKHGGVIEIVKDKKTGELVEPSNCIALAEAIELLLKNDKLAQTYSEEGLNRAKVVFSQKAHVIAMSKLYSDIC